jgi:hypothetical protein
MMNYNYDRVERKLEEMEDDLGMAAVIAEIWEALGHKRVLEILRDHLAEPRESKDRRSMFDHLALDEQSEEEIHREEDDWLTKRLL